MFRLSAIELISYLAMGVMIALAIAHRFEARSLAKRLRGPVAGLLEARDFIRSGGTPDETVVAACRAVEGSLLAAVFDRAVSCRDSVLLRDQAEDEINAQFEDLHESCELIEALGPRLGIVLSVTGTFLVMHTANAQSIPLAGIGAAMISTAAGMGVAIIEAATITKHIRPFANGLSNVCASILNEVCRQTQERSKSPEVNDAA